MSLVLVTFSLLATSPVQAQQPPPHSWQITYANSGTNYSYTPNGGWGNGHYGGATPVTGTWPVGSNSGSAGTYGSIDGSVSGTVTVTLTWIPATGKTLATDPPSETVYIAETAFASEQSQWNGTTAAPIAGSVSDGFGDIPVRTGTSMRAQGINLLQRDGSSGVIVLPSVTLSATSPTCAFVNSGGPEWINSWVSVSLTAAIDTRGVTISSNLDSTNMKGPQYNPNKSVAFDKWGDELFVPKPHVPAADGTMYGDVGIDYGEQHNETYTDVTGTHTRLVFNPSQFAVTYYAHWAGNWATEDAGFFGCLLSKVTPIRAKSIPGFLTAFPLRKPFRL